jgi:hypothetical protein
MSTVWSIRSRRSRRSTGSSPAGLKATPDKVNALLASLPVAVASLPVLIAKAQTTLTAKANNPFGNADDKAKAKADLAALDQIKSKVTGLPAQATQALAKITAALS